MSDFVNSKQTQNMLEQSINPEIALKLESKNRVEYNIYTDGSFLASDSRFGFGYICPTISKIAANEPTEELYPHGYEVDPSNLPQDILKGRNVVSEILASMFAIQLILQTNKNCKIVVNYDYSGVEKFINGEWKPKVDISKYYRAWFYSNNLQYSVRFNHVKAHTDNKGNNLADVFARNSSDGIVTPKLIKNVQPDGREISALVFVTDTVEVVCGFFNELVQ